ncbi:hypothetical protein PLICRDRAFT_274828 [Plicaturopsis crispa FD-325 SS-3]|nr:hypothetical protein PLICRDRAFT_274828 [Plicaturopsis crispa FD-325 SS-3]
MKLFWATTGSIFHAVGGSVLQVQQPWTTSEAPNTIAWKGCGTADSHIYECGRLSVPLDYADVNKGSASLSVVRLLAHPEKRKGSLFTNPGGPGVPGTGAYNRERMRDILRKTSGNFDIVSWDIRGVNDTTPNVKCLSEDEADSFWNDWLWYQGVETNSSLQSTFDLDNFYSHVDKEDALLSDFWDRCNTVSGDVLPFVGTAANARDVASMADAIDGAGSEINYWGFSYGTILGQYIMALFPDRLGRTIIDGPVYGPKWSVEPAVEFYNKLLTDLDKAYLGFADLCAKAGPEGCALASPKATEESILADIDQLLLDTYDPSHSSLPKELSYSASLKAEIVITMQVPSGWQRLATYLRSQKELVAASNTVNAPAAAASVFAARNALHQDLERHESSLFIDMPFYTNYWSIVCSDGPDYDGTTTRDLFDVIVDARKKSARFGPMWPTEGAWPCHHWPVRAVERVTDFSVKPKHPVLLLSNINDPITPIENGIEILQKSFEHGHAGLGIRAGYGHCSYSMKSSCLDDVIQAYMQDWTLPPTNMKTCPTEDDLFPAT